MADRDGAEEIFERTEERSVEERVIRTHRE